MFRTRFVRPQVDVIQLSCGDSITVKKRLNHGEQTAAYQRMYLAGIDGKLSLDHRKVSESIVIAYLVDWTFRDADGAVVPIRGASVEELAAMLNLLDPLDWVELRDAVQAHDVAVAEARVEEKKRQAGEMLSLQTSPSAA